MMFTCLAAAAAAIGAPAISPAGSIQSVKRCWAHFPEPHVSLLPCKAEETFNGVGLCLLGASVYADDGLRCQLGLWAQHAW